MVRDATTGSRRFESTCSGSSPSPVHPVEHRQPRRTLITGPLPVLPNTSVGKRCPRNSFALSALVLAAHHHLPAGHAPVEVEDEARAVHPTLVPATTFTVEAIEARTAEAAARGRVALRQDAATVQLDDRISTHQFVRVAATDIPFTHPEVETSFWAGYLHEQTVVVALATRRRGRRAWCTPLGTAQQVALAGSW